MAQKPSIPKGTRDFSPAEMVRRNFIFDSIKSVFRLYGYLPIETPAMENLSTLLGKYGDEGDKLLFKILNSGDYAEKIPQEKFQKPNSAELTNYITEKGLRYDLTVPFARYVVQHLNEITFPFKRYQVQPVWRADKPQKGRYREFFQCDVDVIGSRSLMYEAELVQIINDVFSRLTLKNTIKLNHRKVLYGIAEFIGETEKFQTLTVAIDKLDKIGIENVIRELENSGFRKDAIEKLMQILEFEGSNEQKIGFLKDIFQSSSSGAQGIQEMAEIFSILQQFTLESEVVFDLSLARGLNYYTGTIFEVMAQDVKIGSICGGGRYDDLTGIFGLPDVSGVGISFGADRIYDVMLELNLFPFETAATTQVMFVNFGEREQHYCIPLAHELRKAGINTEVFPEPAKLKKQMTYANAKNISYVILIGEEEMKQGRFSVKNMVTGDQEKIEVSKITEYFLPLIK